MYPYHNKIKQRIRAGELTGYEYVTDYPRIGEALVLRFSTHPPVRPIRPHRYAEYAPLLRQWQASRPEKQQIQTEAKTRKRAFNRVSRAFQLVSLPHHKFSNLYRFLRNNL